MSNSTDFNPLPLLIRTECRYSPVETRSWVCDTNTVIAMTRLHFPCIRRYSVYSQSHSHMHTHTHLRFSRTPNGCRCFQTLRNSRINLIASLPVSIIKAQTANKQQQQQRSPNTAPALIDPHQLLRRSRAQVWA